MTSQGVLAIDFGTANTYFCKCPDDQVLPEGMDLDGDGRDGLATVILYREGKEALVGRTAYEEFGDATPHERLRYRFRAQFKPDIVASAEAREDAVAFLKGVLENARRSFLDVDPTERRVIVGVPAEADRSFRETLADIATQAGYGSIRTREEPLGALFYHVAHKTLGPSDALRGVLVIDFGGGTCDFAFTYRGKIRKSWGHMNLGGRLFDDLFYQWLMEQNPDVAAALDPADEFFVISHICRNLKEEFSREMTKRGRVEPFTSKMLTLASGRYARLSNAVWESFVERASRYRPSPAFVRHLRAINAGSTLLDTDQPTDLIGWFKRCLVDGLNHADVDRRDIATVILTGGSSQWPFVPDIVRETLHVEAARIRRSDRPYAAISEGLAIEPALQHKLATTRQKLQEGRRRFLDKQVGKQIKQHIEDVAREIADGITAELFDGRIKGTLLRFRKDGGKIADLKSEVAAHAQGFEPRIPAIVSAATDRMFRGLPVLVMDELQKWFEASGLRIERDMLKVTDDRIATDDLCTSELPDLLQDLQKIMAGVLMSIVGLVTASVCGGGGTALIASGPIGWLIGLVLGAVVAYLATKYGMEAARSRAEALPLPAWTLRLAMRDRTIDSARDKLRTQTHEQVLAELHKLQDALRKQVEETVDKEVDALTELHHL